MADTENTSTNPQTSQAPAPAAPVAQIPAAPVVPVAQTPTQAAPIVQPQEPAYIGERLKRDQRALLKDLGFKVKKGEDPKQAVQAIKTKIDARNGERKELRNKLSEVEKSLEEMQARNVANESAIKILAETEMSLLPADKQEAVKKIAGDDPIEVIKQVSALKLLGYVRPGVDAAGKPDSAVTPPVATPVAPAPVVPAAPPAPIAAPAQTAPAAPAPAPQSAEPFNLEQEFKRVKSNYDKNPNEYYAFVMKNLHAIAERASQK